MKLQTLLVLALLAAALTPVSALAHGGVYRGPPYPTVPPISGPGGTPGGARGGRATPSFNPRATTPSLDVRSWETWWALNKEEFFPIRGPAGSGEGGRYAGAGRPPSREEVRQQIIPVLLDMLKDRDKEVRNSTAVALGKVGGEAELPHLLALREDNDRTVVEGAILGLGLLEVEEAEKRLIRIVRDKRHSARERGFAMMALGFSGGTTAREFLLEGLGKPAAQSRARTAHLPALQAMAASLVHGSDLSGAEPLAPDPATGHLIAAIRADKVKDRFFLPVAYSALAKTRDASAQKQTLEGLRHSDSDVRAGAAIALGRVFGEVDKRTARYIAKALSLESDEFPKRLMLISLGRMGGENARKVLLSQLNQRDRQERAFAALALGIMGASDLAPRFEKSMVRTGDHSLKAAYAITLGLMQHTPAAKTIRTLLARDKNPDLRSYLVQALMLLNAKEATEDIARVLVKARTPDLQAAAALSLGLLGGEKTAERLLRRMQDGHTVTVKGAVATALGRMGSAALIEPLEELVRDEKEQDLTRAFGCIALGILGEKEPDIPTFARVAIDSQYDIRLDVLFELRDIL